MHRSLEERSSDRLSRPRSPCGNPCAVLLESPVGFGARRSGSRCCDEAREPSLDPALPPRCSRGATRSSRPHVQVAGRSATAGARGSDQSSLEAGQRFTSKLVRSCTGRRPIPAQPRFKYTPLGLPPETSRPGRQPRCSNSSGGPKTGSQAACPRLAQDLGAPDRRSAQENPGLDLGRIWERRPGIAGRRHGALHCCVTKERARMQCREPSLAPSPSRNRRPAQSKRDPCWRRDPLLYSAPTTQPASTFESCHYPFLGEVSRSWIPETPS
jgi:hypothetical protein